MMRPYVFAGFSRDSISNLKTVKKALLSLMLILAFSGLRAQQEQLLSDSASFEMKFRKARWLCEYEDIAALANDSLRACGKKELTGLGTPGFCFQDSSGNWNIVYGNVEKDKFSVLFHFEAAADFRIWNRETAPDSALVWPVLRSLLKAGRLMKDIVDSTGIHFSQYVQRLTDQTVEVLVFPAFQPSGQAVYGAEWRFLFNPEGTRLLSSTSYFSSLKGVWIGQPRELWLNYRDTDTPTLGSLFFCWSFRDFFTRIHIDTRRLNCTLNKKGPGNFSWETRVKNADPNH